MGRKETISCNNARIDLVLSIRDSKEVKEKGHFLDLNKSSSNTKGFLPLLKDTKSLIFVESN